METLFSFIRWIRTNPEVGGWIALGSICLVVIYAGIMVIAIIRMSPDYFSSGSPAPGTLRQRKPVLRLSLKIFKTFLGLALLVTGTAMLVLPGQGLMTIAIAISFMEFPGKRRLLVTIVNRGEIINALNNIRRKAGKEPLQAPNKT
jgi:hypothetical protein